MRVYCPYSSDGCTEVVNATAMHIQQHVRTCKFAPAVKENFKKATDKCRLCYHPLKNRLKAAHVCNGPAEDVLCDKHGSLQAMSITKDRLVKDDGKDARADSWLDVLWPRHNTNEKRQL